MRKQTLNRILLLFVLAFAGLLIVSPDIARAANPNLINFQGKVVNADGTNVSDASYTFRFCLYTTATPATPCTAGADNDAVWRESKSISTTNGVFQTELGSVTTMIDVSAYTNLYLGINFNADAAGEMTPRIHFDSVPYALNSDKLGGLTSSAFAQLAATNTFTAPNIFNFNGTENLSITSDLAGNVNVFSLIGTPSASAGTTRGLFIQQAASANTNGLDQSIVIDNADDGLAITAAIQFLNSGGGNYTNIFDILGTTLSATEINILDAGLTESEVTGEIEAVTAGNGLSGGGAADSVTLDIDLLASQDGSGATFSFSGLEFQGASSDTLTLLQGCTDNQILKWDDETGGNGRWDCAADATGGGSATLATAYSNGAGQADSTISLDSTRLGVIIMDNDTPLGANLFTVKEHTNDGGSTLFSVTTDGLTVLDTAGNNGLIFDSSDHELKIYDSTAANFASITATPTGATFKSNTGTTTIGGGSGDISLTTTARGDVVVYTHTGSGGGTTDIDFLITRNITGGASTLAHQVLKLEDLSTTSGTDNPSIFMINKTNTGFSGNFVDIQLNGTQKFIINSGGSVSVAAGQSLDTIAAGALTIGTTATSLGINTNTTITGETTGAALTVSNSTSTGNILTLNDNATLVASIADGGGALFQNSVNSQNAFQIKNVAGLSVTNVNTLTSGWNLLPNSSFEQNINPAILKATPTGGTPLWDNTASNTNFGAATLRLSSDAAGDGVSYGFPFKASTQYSLSFYAKVSASTQAYTIGRQDVVATDVDTGCTPTNSITVTTTWTQFTCTFTTGATIGGSSNFYVKQSGAGTPTMFMDGVTLVEGATALAYVNPSNNFQIDADWGNITLNAGQDPEIQPWQLGVNALTTARRGATTVTANGYMYFIGGTTATGAAGAPVTTINFAKINSDGSTQAWSTSGITALPVALYGHSTIVANGYLYVIGGCSDSSVTAACTTPVSTVYYSKLNGDGTNGAWQTNSFALGVPAGAAAPRGYGAAVHNGGFVYFTGGITTAASVQATSFSAKVNGDGSISGWVTSGVTALSTARYGHTITAVNGNLYTIGGCTDTAGVCNTAIATTEWAIPTLIGGLGAWTATTSLATGTGFHSLAVLNGHIYVFGGRQASAAVASVVYSKISGANSLGIWSAAPGAFPLPVARQQAAWIWANNYAYVLGGFDGTATLPLSALYTSGARVLVFGGLDLVGLTGQGLGDFGGGGTLTAGNTRVIGDLRVEGFADFNNGLSVDSAINLNAVSATTGQNVFNINNNLSNSIFSVRHMAANFGSLVTAGAFMQKNSYWGEEYNVGKLATCAPAGAAGNAINFLARGDYGGQGATAACSATAATTVNGGQLSASSVTAGTTTFGTCGYASPGVTTVNGVERITATSVNTAGSTANCVENLAGTTTTSNKIFLAANLPVFSMKVRPSTLPAATAAARVQIGMISSDSANTLGVNSPTQAIYFTNCSTWNNAAVPTGCSNTNWYGVTSTTGASSATVVTCTVGAATLTTNFSYLRIEVRASNDVHFFADYNTADGINESECGTGSATFITASSMTPWAGAMYNAQAAASTALELDYLRGWQDDNVPLPPGTVTETPSGEEIVTEPPLAVDTPSEDPNSFFSLNAALSEDATFENDVYIKGTLFADKIKANQIEGLEIFTDKINSLQDRLTQQSQTDPAAAGAQAQLPSNLNLSSLSLQNVTVFLELNVDGTVKANGGLVVGGSADFRGQTSFQKLVSFMDRVVFRQDISFEGRATFNNDTGGFALIKKDQDKVDVKFDKPYDSSPIITVSVRNGQFVSYIYKEIKNEQTDKIEGFTILLKEPAMSDVEFAWTALNIKDPRTAKQLVPTSTN